MENNPPRVAGDAGHLHWSRRWNPRPFGDGARPATSGSASRRRGSVDGVADVRPTEDADTRRLPPSEGPATARQVVRLLASIARTVTDAGSRDAAERTVCDRLAGSGLYRSAWVGVPPLDGDGVAVRTSDDVADSRRTAPAAVADDDGSHREPWSRALRAGATRVAAVSELGSDAWPATGDGPDRGLVVAVPFGRGDLTDGVLVVHTTRQNAFGTLERAGLELLGATLGVVVDATRSRELLFAGGATEVELRITDEGSLFVRASDALDCRLSLEGYTARGDRWHLDCDVAGADPDAVRSTLAADHAVETCLRTVDRSNGCRVTLETAHLPLLARTSRTGVGVEAAVADHGTCRVTLELPASSDLRGTLGHLRGAFPDLDLRSRRDRDGAATDSTGSGDFLDGLTDRQREALETAYRAGYFEWPRENTAEEVAAILGITSPTFHRHLRTAEGTLLSEFFG